MHLEVPCDSVETEKSTFIIAETDGPGYIRYGREATPVITRSDTPFRYGIANVIRFRDIQQNFIDAFEVVFGPDYKDEKEDLSIVACGPMVAEAMRAAWILKQEFDISARILNVHTVKPIDKISLIRAAEETGRILTVEEQQVTDSET
jgi:transketolase